MATRKRPPKPARVSPTPDVEPDESESRPTITDENDLDLVRDAWESNTYRTPSDGGWLGPDD